MRRREFITLLGGTAATWPLAARAQQADRVRRIGVLISGSENDSEYQAQLATFRDALQQLGWTEGRNMRIDYRRAVDDPALRRALAKELVALQPDVILERATPVLAALLQETRTIPIVFVLVADPVGSKFVQVSRARVATLRASPILSIP
jgi:putative ABC transport system substrate-binding protein